MTSTHSNASYGTVAAEALEQIRRHAIEAYPYECCGALIAIGARVVEAYPLPNTTAEGARRRFLISPSDYQRSEQHANAQRGTLAGFYHSHPDHPARPSPHDLEQAWPNLIYVIIAVRAGDAGEITSWRLRDDRSGFDQGDL